MGAAAAGIARTLSDVAIEEVHAGQELWRGLAAADQRDGQHLERPSALGVVMLEQLGRLRLEEFQQRVIGRAVGAILEVLPVLGTGFLRQLIGVHADGAAQLLVAPFALIEIGEERGELVAENDVAIFHQSYPMIFCWKPNTVRAPLSGTSRTSRACPGSKRPAVPAAISSRMP